MSDFKQQMTGAYHSPNANGALYSLLIGMSLGNILPSPSDAVFFFLESKLRDKWKRGELTASKYWRMNTFYYYSVPFLYWALVALIIINLKGDYQKKIKFTAALIGGGVVLGTILKMIQNDKTQLIKEDEERLHLKQNHPEVIEILKKPEYENISAQLINTPNVEYVKLYRERNEMT